jgi:hypothetical protein
MPLVHSYKVLLAETEAKYYSLKSSFLRSGSSETKGLLDETEKELKWIRDRIAKGKDPGCHVE